MGKNLREGGGDLKIVGMGTIYFTVSLSIVNVFYAPAPNGWMD